VSFDEIIFKKSNQGVLFNYGQIIISDQESCINYSKQLLEILKIMQKASEKEIICVAQVIPYYSFVKWPELAFFMFYTCYNAVDYGMLSFNDFCKRLEKERFLPIFEQIYQLQMLIPTTEIWNIQTIDTTYRLLDYYFEIGAFECKKTALLLLDQFSQILETIKQYADYGFKDSGRKTPFTQYVCSVDLGNAVMLARNEKHLSCTIRLNTINSISADNDLICSDINKWINDLISKSIMISGRSSSRERIQFYNTANSKIEQLIEKINKK
jgi:hypothetical protein